VPLLGVYIALVSVLSELMQYKTCYAFAAGTGSVEYGGVTDSLELCKQYAEL